MYGPDRPLGDPERDIIGEDGSVRGAGPEPSNRATNTGYRFEDFAQGERVLVWWWGFWWFAKVQYCRKRDRTLSIAWEWNRGVVTPGYLPRLVDNLSFPHYSFVHVFDSLTLKYIVNMCAAVPDVRTTARQPRNALGFAAPEYRIESILIR